VVEAEAVGAVVAGVLVCGAFCDVVVGAGAGLLAEGAGVAAGVAGDTEAGSAVCA
jgi:hypothetical protein